MAAKLVSGGEAEAMEDGPAALANDKKRKRRRERRIMHRERKRERKRTEQEEEKKKQEQQQQQQQQLQQLQQQHQKKNHQLVVLDINGLLVDTYFTSKGSLKRAAYKRVGKIRVYKRPFCDEFVKFCLDNFLVGIWSSARWRNVDMLAQYIFGQDKAKLAFIWHQEHCTDTGMRDPDNKYKPLFLKELSKLWGKSDPNLPWQIGEYGPTNTLLIDDTPYKALRNPPNSAIFPEPYDAHNSDDNLLGSVFLSYLKGIMQCEDMQRYVESNPFGQPMLSSTSPHWSYFSQLLSTQPEKATVHYFAEEQ